VGTNYYVSAPACAKACEHCTATERLHLGKSSGGWRFLFYAEPDWPRDEAFAHWVRRALSGPIADEYGRDVSLAELMEMIDAKADGIDHLNRPPGPQYGRPSPSDFKCCGYDFSASAFS
jgi:hypothetical protein